MTTIVSAFIAGNNKHRGSVSYINHARHLLSINKPKIIFLQREIIEHLKDFQNEHTLFVPFEKEELFLHKYTSNSIRLPAIRYAPKDTLERMMIWLNKVDWVKRAIEIDPYKTEQFVWIDFGLHHVFPSTEIFTQCVRKVSSSFYPKVRIAGIWNINYNINRADLRWESKIFDKPQWFLAGGVFGGSKDKLLVFAELVEQESQQMIAHGRISWEVNVWYLICLDHPDLFSIYQCNHNLTILSHY